MLQELFFAELRVDSFLFLEKLCEKSIVFSSMVRRPVGAFKTAEGVC